MAFIATTLARRFGRSTNMGELMPFTKFDLKVLKSVGIRANDTTFDDEQLAQPDGTIRLLEEYGIPVTRENYLNLAFAGNPPQELDAEVEAEIPDTFEDHGGN